ncbi:HAD-superfamily hydrolase [Anaeromyces robustus]|jgi:HAD superfamily hydrolase (TIGR01456 family)|uniref:HAD-superfamily hydrolase n=1 Tax=Anaeromyces robustus TaxID=1754192 RepID=A0A1Y1WZP1_9FUNG|nr:HAD-superfamily hydrolase [Anaeromyces robustus]|eukprot:ORX79010.1 HAD-superfamily hydrolase [Anaeromyces robustus]
MNTIIVNSLKNSSVSQFNTLTFETCINKIFIQQLHNSKPKAPSATPETLNLNINKNIELKEKLTNTNNNIKNLDILINPQQQTNIQTPKLDVNINLEVTKHKKPGIVFDIDGVLVKGKNVLPETFKTLKILDTLHIPYIFLTNGGGKTEKKKAQELSKRFHVPIREEQIVLGHSPMRNVPDEIKKKITLIIGPDTCKEVAKSYGFEKPVLSKEILSWKPEIWPFEDQIMFDCPYDLDKESFGAVLMFSDSCTWGQDIQIACDIFRSQNGKLGTQQVPYVKQAVPCYFAAADLLWSNNFPLSRFGQGAFKIALSKLFKELTGKPIEIIQFGKPEKTTYDFAKELLEKFSKNYLNEEISNVYAVGDNPSVDILGANNYGWHSILVRTGVFKTGENDKIYPAKTVVNNVLDSVKFILSQENLLNENEN